MKCVYLISAQGLPDYKIGISADPKRRMYSIQSGNSRKLTYEKKAILPADDAEALERLIHRDFQKHWSGGGREWYTLRKRHVNRIKRMMDQYIAACDELGEQHAYRMNEHMDMIQEQMDLYSGSK